MEEFKDFLESSTIHGLTYISTTRKLVRVFWILVVIFGFSTASFLIYQSFQAWEESPVSTTIETLPITKIRFPKVTVCPPKNTYTDLNHDLASLHSLDNNTRNMIKNYAIGLLYEHLHDSFFKDLALLQDDMRYHNWYQGYTQVNFPSREQYAGQEFGMSYSISTYSSSGSISSQHFGEEYDVDNVKVVSDIRYTINIVPPEYVRQYYDVTLHVQIEKASLEESGYEEFSYKSKVLNTDVKNYTQQINPPGGDSNEIKLERRIPWENIATIKMQLMPGFRIRWFYTGQNVQSEAMYYSGYQAQAEYQTKLFIRYYSLKRKISYVKTQSRSSSGLLGQF